MNNIMTFPSSVNPADDDNWTAELERDERMNAFDNHHWKAAKECIAKGDKARTRSDNLYITAGQHLKVLKVAHDERGGTWDAWEALLKERVGIGKSRASELMQIADGTKTVEGIREATAEKIRQIRARKSSPVRTGENAADIEAERDAKSITQSKLSADGGETDDMPTAEETEQSYQETLYDQACLLLESMSGETRQKFLAKQPVRKPVKHDARIICPELAERVGRLARRLVRLDVDLARELVDLILQRGVAERLWADLGTGIEIEGSDADDTERTL